MPPADLSALLREVEDLARAIEAEAAATLERWQGWIADPAYAPSAANFARYLALRHHDLREMQRRLMAAGLSSLGRAESRVGPTLAAVAGLLAAATGAPPPAAADEDFFAGEARIAARADALLGPVSPEGPVRLMVTLPSEAADDPAFARRLAAMGVEAVRINCAHDDEPAWGRMIAHAGAAARAQGRPIKVMMDLPGPKIRTGALRDRKGLRRVRRGDLMAIVRPGLLEQAPHGLAAVECTLSPALAGAAPGHRIFVDDGRLSTVVRGTADWGVTVEILGDGEGPAAGAEAKGYRLKPEKGINFPDSEVAVPALTDDDRAILPFVAGHADAIEFSFVQGPDDVADLQQALAGLRPDDWRRMGLVLKVETRRAVRALPDMVVRAAGSQPAALMIARGDLAVEIGFARLAEIQEEILWLGEAAQVPVIWATQVLESWVKTGLPSRGEMTDAAMAARAECIMLNKGPFLFEAVAELDRLMARMKGHIGKKSHRLRPLTSW